MESDLTEQKLISRNAFLKKSFTEDTLPISEVAGNRVVKNKELVCFRTPIVKSSITDYKISALEADAQIKDLQQFEEGLWAIVENKFSTISREYLYARDISSTQYGEYVFGKPELIFQKAIVADNLCKIVTSQFDWSVIDSSGKQIPAITEELLKKEESMVHSLLVPECDQYGYSLTNIDELDCLLLQTVKEPKSIRDLFEQIKFAFDPDDLAISVPEFEKLIFGRIKNGLLNKSIKVFNMMAHD